MCEGCAPDAQEAAGKRAAQIKVEHAVQRAAEGGAVASVTCATCGTQMRGAGKFCESCGSPVGQRQCKHCQAELSPGARFCGACGGAQA
jgi:predicted amidophosphoribosyltransferase